MAHKVIDRCNETTSTTGTGTLTLTGAVANFMAMADATGGLTTDGDTSWFLAENGAEWELFLGTRVDATHLARTTVIKSSNGGAAVSFTAPPTVFSTVPAEKISAVGPSFSAYRATSTHAVTSGALTKVQFNAEDFDNGDCFDSATNYRWTPNVAGYYQVSAAVNITASSGMATVQAHIYKNGASIAIGNYVPGPSTTDTIASVSRLVYMNGTTDYLEIWIYANGTSPVVAFTKGTFFTGFLAALPGAPMLAPKPVGPAFSAYRSGNQTGITNTTYVKAQLNAEEFDTDGCFDSTTNYRFTPNVEGYYNFQWSIDCRGTTLTVGHAQLYKNGVAHKSGIWAASSSSVAVSAGSATVYMNGSTDYVELFGYTAAASGNLFNSGAAATYLSGHFVRGA